MNYRKLGRTNFQVSDMEALFRVPGGDRCATNQVLYNLGSRAIERHLLPWCERHGTRALLEEIRRTVPKL